MLGIITEKETHAKALTVCPDCHEIIGVQVTLGQSTQCYLCGLWFKFTRRVVRRG